MSYRLAMWIRENADLDRAQVDVLEALATHANDDGSSCRPSIDKVSYLSRYTRRHVLSVMPDLVKAGILEEVRAATGTRPAEYRIHQNRIPKLAPYKVWLEEHGRSAKSSGSMALTDAPVAPQTVLSSGEATTPLRDEVAEAIQPKGEVTAPLVVKPFPASGETIAHDSSQDSVNHSVNTSPVPNATGSGDHVTNKKIQPYELVQAMLTVTGGSLSQAATKTQCGIAKSLVADGITVDEVTGISQWLHSQPWWRDRGIDMKSVKGQLSRWESIGRPTKDINRATANQPTNVSSSISRDQATAERQLAAELEALGV